MEQGAVAFRQSRSLFFKRMQIVRGCDAKRNVLIYMVYSDKDRGQPEELDLLRADHALGRVGRGASLRRLGQLTRLTMNNSQHDVAWPFTTPEIMSNMSDAPRRVPKIRGKRRRRRIRRLAEPCCRRMATGVHSAGKHPMSLKTLLAAALLVTTASTAMAQTAQPTQRPRSRGRRRRPRRPRPRRPPPSVPQRPRPPRRLPPRRLPPSAPRQRHPPRRSRRRQPRAPAAAQSQLVNLNTASKDELDKLPQIGDARAAAIIAKRPYRDWADFVAKGVVPPTPRPRSRTRSASADR